MSLTRLRALVRLSAVRQALWLLALFIGVSVVTWGAAFVLVQREMLRSVDARLEARMVLTLEALDAGQDLPALERGDTAEILERPQRAGFATRDAPGTETEMRYLVRATPHGLLQLGEETELQEELLDILAGGMRLSLAATLTLTVLAAVWMARRSQARLNAINAGLTDVARGDLSTRITLEGRDDLSLLAARIDATTAQLEHAMRQMRVQSSNIAHDLRTPLARLRAEIERGWIGALEQGRPVDPETLGAALDQIDGITGTFDALLRLSRLESGAGRDAFAPVTLADLVESVAETFGPVVEDAGQTLRTDVATTARIDGDHDLLVQLLANLLQNALRHGAERQTIVLRAEGTCLTVSDEGPGIPETERENVLQPLYQGERTRQGEGYGLGLALVRAIAELHRAELTLGDRPKGRGLRVSVRFPTA